MKFMAQLHLLEERFAEAVLPPTREDEAEQARVLYKDGMIEQIWNRVDQAGACMVLEAADEAAARSALDSLPFVAAGFLEIEALVPLKPYGGFGPRHS